MRFRRRLEFRSPPFLHPNHPTTFLSRAFITGDQVNSSGFDEETPSCFAISFNIVIYLFLYNARIVFYHLRSEKNHFPGPALDPTIRPRDCHTYPNATQFQHTGEASREAGILFHEEFPRTLYDRFRATNRLCMLTNQYSDRIDFFIQPTNSFKNASIRYLNAFNY